jgi:GT2 family glycosyltransferase
VTVSIVIVSYNGRDYLRRCLASLQEHLRAVEHEVIVVDNASRDGTPGMVREEFPNVQLIARGTNAGFAGGVNHGLREARGDAFLLLNPDTTIDGDVVSPMLAYLRGHPDIGILAPKLTNEDGSLQLSCRAFPGFSTALFNRYSLLTRLLPTNRFSRRYLMSDFDHSRSADVDWASAACWLLPRATYEGVGPLDERYFWSIEDVDYCQRVHRAGLRVVYFPEVSVRHRIGGSSDTAPARTLVGRHRGMWRYYTSYLRPRATLLRLPVDAGIALGIGLRCGLLLASSGVRRLVTRVRRARESAQ